MLIWLTTAAFALPPEAGAMGLAEFTNGEGPDVGGYGADLFATAWATPWLGVDGHVQLVGGVDGAQVSFFPELRIRVTGGDPARGALALAAGFGARFPSEVIPRGTVGAVADIPVSDVVFIRPQVRYLFADVASPGAGQFGLGVVWRGRVKVEPVAVPDPVPQPVVAEAPPAVRVDPAGAMVWLPHPVCEWIPAARVGDMVGKLLPADRLRFAAAGYLPQEATAGGLGDITLRPAPAQGSILVVAESGDSVKIGGQEVVTAADGVALVSVPEGVVTGSVVGGGRSVSFEVAVGSGYAVWVRAPEPHAIRIAFGRGVSTLAPADLAIVSDVAHAAGGWTFLVQGSASADGTASANLSLADERSAVVAAALYAAGIPASRVVVRPAVVADEHTDPVVARSAVLIPVPIGGGS